MMSSNKFPKTIQANISTLRLSKARRTPAEPECAAAAAANSNPNNAPEIPTSGTTSVSVAITPARSHQKSRIFQLLTLRTTAEPLGQRKSLAFDDLHLNDLM